MGIVTFRERVSAPRVTGGAARRIRPGFSRETEGGAHSAPDSGTSARVRTYYEGLPFISGANRPLALYNVNPSRREDS